MIDVVKETKGYVTLKFYQNDKIINTISDNNKILSSAKTMMSSAILHQEYQIKYIKLYYRDSISSNVTKQMTVNIKETNLIDGNGLNSDLEEVNDGKYAIRGVSYSIFTNEFQAGSVISKVELCCGFGTKVNIHDLPFSEKEVIEWQIPPMTSIAVMWKIFF